MRDGRLLVARRAPEDSFGGMWEFPGGKIEAGERPAEAARRELEEESALIAGRLVALGRFDFDTLTFHLFLAPDATGTVVTESGQEHRWVVPTELDGLEMPPANATMFPAIARAVAGSSP